MPPGGRKPAWGKRFARVSRFDAVGGRRYVPRDDLPLPDAQRGNPRGGLMATAERSRGISVARALEIQAAGNPDGVFLIYGDRRYTFAQVDARSTALAAALHELGIERNDRIALDLPNWPEFIISLFAAAKLGAVELAARIKARDVSAAVRGHGGRGRPVVR